MANGIVIFPEEYWDLYDKGDELASLEMMEREAYKTNDPDIFFFLGQEYGVYASQEICDFSKAYKWFSAGSRFKHAACMHEAGIALLKGLGVPVNHEAGLRNIREAALLKNEVALNFLMSEQMQNEFNFEVSREECTQFQFLLENTNHAT